MKKIIFSLLFTFTLMFISNVESKGQCTCPSGYTPQSVNLNLGSGCVITIDYCMLCHPTGNPEANLCQVRIPNTCVGLNIDLAFWTNVRNAMIADLALKCSYSGGIGPCPQRTSFSVFQAFCMGIYPNDPQNPTGYIIKPCDGEAGVCYKQYEVCYQGLDLIVTTVNTQVTPAGCDFMEFEFDPNDIPYYCFSACP